MNDGSVEGLERVLIKLLAPAGGATLSSPSIASAYLSDPGDASIVEFSTDAVSIAERGFATAVAVVRRSGSAKGPLSVNYEITNGDANNGSDYSGPTTGTVNWIDGGAIVTLDGSGSNDPDGDSLTYA